MEEEDILPALTLYNEEKFIYLIYRILYTYNITYIPEKLVRSILEFLQLTTL